MAATIHSHTDKWKREVLTFTTNPVPSVSVWRTNFTASNIVKCEYHVHVCTREM